MIRNMAAKGYRKLVDIAETSTRLQETLNLFCTAHGIPFKRHLHEADGLYRYYVPGKQLSAAQAVIPALAMARGER